MSFHGTDLIGVARRHRLVICLCVMVVVASLVWLSARPKLVVHGDFSQQEVSQIVKAVKHDVWRTAFPDSSWSTLKGAPRALWAVAGVRIYEVSQTFKDRVLVKGN